MRDRLGSLVPKIDIEHSDIAALMSDQLQCPGYRQRGADYFEPGIRQLPRDIKRYQSIVLNHKHTCGQV